MSDIAEIKKNTDIVQIIGRFIDLKHDGKHWVANCPFHPDKTGSLKVTPSMNKYTCFGCKEHGDVFDFLVRMGRTFPEAIQYLSDPNNTSAKPYTGAKNKSVKKETEVVWKQIIPGIEVDGMFHHYKHGLPVKYWPWYDEKGRLMGYTCRFEFKGGKKEVLPLIYATDGNRSIWMYRGFEKPRPLFNKHKMAASGPDVAILVVEGEKTVKAAEKLFPNVIVTCWIGGVAGVKYTDWNILQGRVVVLWPDNDQPGYDAMHEIYSIIKSDAKIITWTNPPAEVEKGWDLADADWDIPKAREYAKSNTIDYPGKAHKWIDPTVAVESKTRSIDLSSVTYSDPREYKEDGSEEEKGVVVKMKVVPPPSGPPNQDDPDDYKLQGSEHFKMLGAQKEGNGMVYYFYSFSTRTVIGLSPSAMTRNNMMQLAPLNWWKNTFYDTKSSFAVDSAADYLINMSARVGTYSDKRLRGRGAWIDGKKVVIHTGDKLIVDGVETELSKFESKFIYEIGEELEISVLQPLDDSESLKLFPLLQKLNWIRAIDPYLLAGWIVVAPICGALTWRPHIWLTGPSGSGKSTVFDKLISFLLGNLALAFQGETSEPGIRQALQHDALPVMFDEAEGEDQKALARMKSVMGLMRASSSKNGGAIGKGAPGGSGGKTYSAKSCFAFASIVYLADQQADMSRISVLSLQAPNSEQARKNYVEFQKLYAELIDEEFSRALRARTMSILPNILTNIKTFTAAAAAVIGAQRAGDQIGVLLAGAYSLQSSNVITMEEAMKWVSAREWDEEKDTSAEKDEVLLIHFILQQPLRVETRSATVERTIGELVLCAMGLVTPENDISPGHANERLKRNGLKVVDDYLLISNSDASLHKMLNGSSWPKNHNKILERLPNAEKMKGQRFSAGVTTRAVKIPKVTLFGENFRAEPFSPAILLEVPAPVATAEPDKKNYSIEDTQSEIDYNDPNL